MVKNYKKLGIVNKKLKEFKQKKYTPLNDIVIGLLYIEKGETRTGITILDDFINKEEKLIVTKGVKKYSECRFINKKWIRYR